MKYGLAGIASGLHVLFLFVLSSPYTTAAEPIRLRVLSYNIHHAEGVDRNLDLERIARVILAAKPDLVALQEVDKQAKRTGSVDQPAELARLTKMQLAFGPNIDLQGGQYGNAILSRFPIDRHENHALPNIDAGEQRGVLEARIKTSGGVILFLATHLDHRRKDAERVASAKAINERAAKWNGPSLLAGDLNDVVGSETLDQLESMWQHTTAKPLATIPVDQPRRQIDFILYRPEARWRVADVKVLDESVASDHRPILAELELLTRE